MAVNVPENLCVGCGTATKAGDRRSVFGQSKDGIKNFYESILPCCSDLDEVRNKTITERQRFMCRDCYRKYERFLSLYGTLASGVEHFLSKVEEKEGESSSQTMQVPMRPTKRKAITDDSRPAKRRENRSFSKATGDTVSPGVSVCLQ